MKTITELLRHADLPPMYEYKDRKTPVLKAQDNLQGRTHYVDPATLRYHKARIVSALPVSGGAFYKIIESTALDWDNTKRGFRAVVFDIFGSTVYCPDLDNCHKTKEKAEKAFYKWFNEFNEYDHYREKIQTELAETKSKINRLEEILGNFNSIPHSLTEKELTA